MWKLENGVEIPYIGFGTWQMKGIDVIKPLECALENGYVHIDTAFIYNNETEIGKVIKNYDRRKLFITSKLPPIHHGYQQALDSFEKSIGNLDCEYLDLYLIHWPGASKKKVDSPENAKMRKGSWLALEKLYHDGRVRAIGVSNYTVDHLKELFTYCTVKPHVNQVEFHPWCFPSDLLSFCNSHNILIEAYSPLAQGMFMDCKELGDLADNYKRSRAQILLRWSFQHGVVILPKSVTPERIIENLDIFDFELSKEDATMMDKWNRNQHVCWDPNTIL